MARGRTFAALIDQDSVIVIEYEQEEGGFRVLTQRADNRRFVSAEVAADAVRDLLGEMNAKSASVSIVLQHFGSFFHALVMPPAPDDVLRPAILREIQRSFNIADPAIAYTAGESVERRDAARAGGGQLPRQVLIAGAPNSVVGEIAARLGKARIHVEGLTVIPEVFRRLYDSLDGSNEATAMLVCLQNGPHVAFFVNGQLELAIDPPPALEGEAPMDASVIIDQLERGGIFLRQQARGTVATRLLLAAPAADYEHLASTVEARTGMRVASLGNGIGSPETVVAMGAVLAARAENNLDLYPRPPAFDERLKRAMTGPGLVRSLVFAAAAVAAFWCAAQVLTVRRERANVERLQTQVERALPAVSNARKSAEGRARIAAIRSTLEASNLERAAFAQLMTSIASAAQPGTQLDSVSVSRIEDGLQTKIYCRALAATGPAAMSAATGFYQRLRVQKALKKLEFQSAYSPRVSPPAGGAPAEDLRFTVSFVAPAGDR